MILRFLLLVIYSKTLLKRWNDPSGIVVLPVNYNSIYLVKHLIFFHLAGFFDLAGILKTYSIELT